MVTDVRKVKWIIISGLFEPNIFMNHQNVSKRIIIIVSLVIASNSIICQPLNNNFSVGNNLEIFSNDSIKIYYNCTGSIVEKRCASFFRIGKIDTLYSNVNGKFKDYFITGEISFIGTMRYGKLNGIGTYFYRNGRVAEIGLYNNNNRIGEWKYYYRNGRPMKTFYFDEGDPIVISFYDTVGVQKVNNGYGNYEGYFNGYKGCFPYMISGKISDGKKDSVWRFSGIDSEVYDKGKFIPGNPGNKDYEQKPTIKLQGFIANENCSIVNNNSGCPGDNIFFAEYKGGNLLDTFYPNLERKLQKLLNRNTKNQWIIIGIEIDKNDHLSHVNVHSSINDTVVEGLIYDIIYQSKGNWKAARINKEKVETPLLFTMTINY